MAILMTNEVTTTGCQFNNRTEYYNFLKVSSSLEEQENELMQRYLNENKMIDHQLEFNGDKIKTKKYFDTLESATSFLNELTTLYTYHSVEWEAVKAEHNWSSVMTIEASPHPAFM